MPLDFTQISDQIERLSQLATGADLQRRIALAQALIQNTDPVALPVRLE